tara:strand:- start:4009 stop:5358 length:1350 start_codon:yes stop_codon:yes gene_type:complete
MAITWRNVDAPNAGGAVSLFNQAGRSLNSGFDGLKDVLAQYQTQEKANWDSGKEQNTQAFLDRLSQVRTPEEMAALQASGQLDQDRAQYGAQIDRSAVRNALDTRGDFLRQQATNQMAYNNQAQDNSDAPILNGLLAEARQIDIGDPKQVEAQLNLLEKKLGQSGLSTRGQATAAQGLVDIRRSLLGDHQTVEQIGNARTRLGFEGRRVADMEANSAQRRTITGDQHQWALDERNAEIAANQVMQNGGSLADVRSAVSQNLGNAPVGLLNNVLSKVSSSYGQLTGLTPEQDEERVKALTPYESEVAVAQKYVDSQPVFSQAVNDNVSESEAIAQVSKLTPKEEDNTSKQFQDLVKELRSNKDLNIPKDANLGPVILAAAKMAGIDEAWIGDDSFDDADVKRVLPKVYNEYVQYMSYQDQLSKAQKARDTANQELMDRYKIRNALKPSSK